MIRMIDYGVTASLIVAQVASAAEYDDHVATTHVFSCNFCAHRAFTRRAVLLHKRTHHPAQATFELSGYDGLDLLDEAPLNLHPVGASTNQEPAVVASPTAASQVSPGGASAAMATIALSGGVQGGVRMAPAPRGGVNGSQASAPPGLVVG